MYEFCFSRVTDFNAKAPAVVVLELGMDVDVIDFKKFLYCKRGLSSIPYEK